jgi:hypothetical protein
MYESGARNLIVGPAQFPDNLDRYVSKHRYRGEAKEIWAEWQCLQFDETGVPFSTSYGEGFCDGYVDYMLLGGRGEPPYLPPRFYWWDGILGISPEERWNASAEWFEGFRNGSQVAMELHGDMIRIAPSDVISGRTGGDAEMDPYSEANGAGERRDEIPAGTLADEAVNQNGPKRPHE